LLNSEWNGQDGEEEDADWNDSNVEPSEPESVAEPAVSSASVTSSLAQTTPSAASFNQNLSSSSDLSPDVQTAEAPMDTVSTDASWLPSSSPGVVAGVDIAQLPPVQRELFLRLHRQQQSNVVPETVTPPPVTSAPVANVVAGKLLIVSFAGTSLPRTWIFSSGRHIICDLIFNLGLRIAK
jgi:hypothetical protein